MCAGVPFLGVAGFVPPILLLSVSFFVLFVARKVDSKGLKLFGYVIAALLCICAAALLAIGIFTAVSRSRPMSRSMHMPHPRMQEEMMHQ